MAAPRRRQQTSVLRSLVCALVRFLRSLLDMVGREPAAPRRARPERWWRPRLRKLQRSAAVRPADLQRMLADARLRRHHELQDDDKISAVAARFHVPESDFFADRSHVDRLLAAILKLNPPWLHAGRHLSGEEQGSSDESATLWRDEEVRSVQDVTLFVPDESWKDKPLASLTLEPARTLRDAWHARLLDQVLPSEVLVDRISRGEVLVPVAHARHQRLEFRPEQRRMELVHRRRFPVRVELSGGAGQGGQILYILLDASASMQGKSAVYALAVAAAVVRARMGERNTRYLFRSYADEDSLFPRVVELPLQARNVEEKDRLLDQILATNFHGGATHVNHALSVAARDIENLRRDEQLEAELLLVTDGRAELMESTITRLRAARIRVHTVMVNGERHSSLEALSESFTPLTISLEELRN